ncbi:MAG: hypothetical protein HWN66_11550 [Candidatus Helarchaeota archaeon]|nr:hypothetical protein [Candidatus Helarchaeota archaeon]
MSLKEIPDRIFVSLGRRGFDPVNPKQCSECGNVAPTGLKLLEKIEYEDVKHEEGFKRMVDYRIQCLQCKNTFFIRLQHVFQRIDEKEKRVTTLVNILDEQMKDIGWLGNY